jgi:hypothetical protein
MQVTAITVPHKSQKYDTVGDYEWFRDVINIRVSDMKNEDYHFLVLAHELVEAYLCKKRGVRLKDIDMFDNHYQGDGEPGDELNAPYHKEHVLATSIEMLLAKELGVDWEVYDKAVMSLE